MKTVISTAITNKAVSLISTYVLLLEILVRSRMLRVILLAVMGLFVVVDADFECETKLISVGCFQDDVNDRALPTQILNERTSRSAVYDGFLIQWDDKYYTSSFACRCARKAESLGYTHFGIQFYGECWSGKNAHLTYDKHGKSKSCKTYVNVPPCSILAGKADTNFVYKLSDRKCDVEYKSLGCFKDSMRRPRPVPQYSLNERDSSAKGWNGHTIDWQKWNQYLPGLICRCARKARTLSHDIFSIQYYGECWTGEKINSNYARDGPSDKCIGRDFKPCKCFDYHCSGVEDVNYVYELGYLSQQYVPTSDVSQDSLFHPRDYDYYENPSYRKKGDFPRYRRKYARGYRQ